MLGLIEISASNRLQIENAQTILLNSKMIKCCCWRWTLENAPKILHLFIYTIRSMLKRKTDFYCLTQLNRADAQFVVFLGGPVPNLFTWIRRMKAIKSHADTLNIEVTSSAQWIRIALESYIKWNMTLVERK